MDKLDYVTAPAAWASALVNNDRSGLSESDKAALDIWLSKMKRDLPGFAVLDVHRDSNGEPAEPRFTWMFELYGGTAVGGEVIDYVVTYD